MPSWSVPYPNSRGRKNSLFICLRSHSVAQDRSEIEVALRQIRANKVHGACQRLWKQKPLGLSGSSLQSWETLTRSEKSCHCRKSLITHLNKPSNLWSRRNHYYWKGKGSFRNVSGATLVLSSKEAAGSIELRERVQWNVGYTRAYRGFFPRWKKLRTKAPTHLRSYCNFNYLPAWHV